MNDAEAQAQTQQLLLLLGVLLIFRAVMAAMLPLSFDEAYYWRWSQNLAAGYLDHPPLIAYVIRAGTLVFGDSEFGVRFVPFLLSVAASWALWRAATMLLGDSYAGAIAALVYNFTLMAGIEAMVATPDAPSMAAAAFFLWALAKVAVTSDGRWWLAAGIAGGFALLSKYTGFFLGAGALLWLALVPNERQWLRSFWPYLGALIALFMFVPVIVWNASHDWISFERQFGRAAVEPLTLRFLGEFLAAQIALATPFIFALGIAGLFAILAKGKMRNSNLGLAALLIVPAMAYFLWHSLHDRVQGNWPSFLYPMFAICTVVAMRWEAVGWKGWLLRISRAAALPVALLFTLLGYAQALAPIFPVEGTRDPIARLLGVGYEPLAYQIERQRLLLGAPVVLTTSYAQTGWLSFYIPSNAWIYQISERERWLAEPPPPPEIFDGQMLYVTETRRDMAEMLAERFETVERLDTLERRRGDVLIEEYALYRVNGQREPVLE